MGKHDKRELTGDAEFYQAKVERLEQKVRELSRDVEANEHEIEKKNGIIKEIRGELDRLTVENAKLRNALIKAVVGE